MISFSLLFFFLITQEEESVAQKAVGSVGSGLAVRGSGALQSRRIGFQLNWSFDQDLTVNNYIS